MSNIPSSPQQQQVNLQVRYEEFVARYANQVLVNATAEEIYFDFSPGVVNAGQGQAILPISTRIVMNPNGALRLYQTLGQALQNYKIVRTNPETPTPIGDTPAASVDNGKESEIGGS